MADLLSELKEAEQKLSISKVVGWTRFRSKVLAEIQHPANDKGSNIPHLAAVFHAVLEELTYGPLFIDQKFSFVKNKLRKTFRVDIVSRGGSRWTKIKAESARNTHRKCSFMPKYGEKTILHVAQEMVEGAAMNQIHFRTPEIYFKFVHAVTSSVCTGLQVLGIHVWGEVVDDPSTANAIATDEFSDEGEPQEEHSSASLLTDSAPCEPRPSHGYKINLDVTAAVAYITDLCNPSAERDTLPYQLDGIFEWMRQDEAEHPAVSLIEPHLASGVVMCTSAWNSFSSIVQTIAGPLERLRFAQLRRQLTVVSDQPSARACGLAKAKKINSMTIAVFGTGDTFQIPTLTANSSFLRATKDKGVDFSAILHPARALSEQKRLAAQGPHIPFVRCCICGF